MRAKHGGFRKGAGRPKGSKNRSTIAREARQREALAADREANANLMPVDYLLGKPSLIAAAHPRAAGPNGWFPCARRRYRCGNDICRLLRDCALKAIRNGGVE
jgi:hypothetical protein